MSRAAPLLRTLAARSTRTALIVAVWLLTADRAWGFRHLLREAVIPTRDGTTLAADVYLPAEEGNWPAILIQTPYDRRTFRLVFPLELSDDPLFKSPDYAFVVVDWRGFFGSSAAAAVGYDRGLDGYDAVEWTAAQGWCNGNVGSWGPSALAVIQFKTAAHRPPHLAGCVPVVGHARDSYELYYPGGVYARNKNSFVAGHFGGEGLIRAHPYEDGLWTQAEAAGPRPDEIDVPMLHISGWYDHEAAISIAEAQAIRDGGGPRARGAQWLLIGPWSHSHVGQRAQGELEYPAAEGEAAREALSFFDHVLRGVANGWEERSFSRYFRIDEDRWESASAWPPPGTVDLTLYLQRDGFLETAVPPSSEIAVRVDPADPVPTLFGAILVEGASLHQGPGDLQPIEARADVLGFTSPSLAAPLRLAGSAVVHLTIATDVVDTDLAVRLTHVTPEGRSLLLVDGIRRVSLRETFATPSWLEPGTPVSVQIELPPLAATIPAGHRLRVLVAPSNYDRFDVNPQDGSPLSDAPGATPVPAEVHLLLGGSQPSHIDLPIDLAPRVRRAVRAIR